MSLPKHIADAIKAGKAEREEFLREQREAAEKKAAEERVAQEAYLKRLRREAEKWFADELPSLIRIALKTGSRSVGIGSHTEGRTRANICRENGLLVADEWHEGYRGNADDPGFNSYTSYTIRLEHDT